MPGLRDLTLAELLATRLCHDLSGPASGLLAALGEADADPGALDLARESAAVLRSRMLLLRAAWGAPAPLEGSALRDLAAGLPGGHRLHLALHDTLTKATLPGPVARLVVNAMLLAAESLPAGGTIAIAGAPDGSLVVQPEGRGAAWPPGLGALLANPDAAWAALGDERPQTLLPALLALLAQAAGVTVRLLLAGTAEAVPPLLIDLHRA